MPERHDGSQDGHSHYVGKNSVATISNAISFGTRVNVLLSILYSKTSCWDVRGKMAWENLLSEGKRESWITKLLLSCTTERRETGVLDHKASSFMYHCLAVTTSIKCFQPPLPLLRKHFITSALSL